MPLSIALVEPQYPVNVGHVARLMKNFGLRRLYLVNPSFDSDEAVKYSTHGKQILSNAERLNSVGQLKKRCDLLLGTTAIYATSRLNVLRARTSPEQCALMVSNLVQSKRRVCLLLGREASGLNNAELALCDIVTSIETGTRYRTMNIAHALAILLYEISKHDTVSDATPPTKKRIDPATKKDLDLLLSYVGKAADASGYDDHKKRLLDHAARRIIVRASPNTKDVMLLVSLFRKCLLAIDRATVQKPHLDMP
ncbi:MAG: TrmH family RNA methyltransferase [Nitrososphaera sp.]